MDYVSIRVSTLRGDQKIDFNTYVKINDKMILYLRKGDSFEGARLQRLREKNLKKMFILSEEEGYYRQYLQKNIESAYQDKGKDLSSRAEIIQGTQQSYTEEVLENPQSTAAYAVAKDAAGRYVDFMMNNTAALQAILRVENNDKNIAHHGVNVATLSIALAQRTGLTDPKKCQLLSLGALLHDIGHQGTSLVLDQKLVDMSPEDKTLWTQHPLQGANKVKDKQHFDTTVINIIAEHEETINGQGPRGLREKDLDPLSIIVSTANAMDRLMTYENVPQEAAAKSLMLDHVGKYPLTYIQELNNILKGL